ncbi:MAG: hypothetical protein NC131_18685 [Roseburia sp.]|nr:hypothetical protein [Roseburia sp.]
MDEKRLYNLAWVGVCELIDKYGAYIEEASNDGMAAQYEEMVAQYEKDKRQIVAKLETL